MIHYVVMLATLFVNVATASLKDAQQFRAAGKKLEAIDAFEQTIMQEPENGDAYFEYAMYLVELDEKQHYEKTINLLHRACEIKEDINWWFQLGCQSCRYGNMEQSLRAYNKIIEKYPHQISATYNMGYTLKSMGKIHEAMNIYNYVLDKKPDYEAAHLGLAFAYIALADFKRGWEEHKWNLKKQGKFAPELRALYENNDIAGKTILLTPEGGLGDSINFLRYVQKLKHMGARTVVAIQKELIPLCSRCDYIDHLVPTRSNRSVPAYHASCTLMSLAPLFAQEEHEITQNIPYITPDPDRVAYWHEKLKDDSNFKIGICWQPSVHNDLSRLPIARRGIPLSQFYKLGSTPGVTVYSLQCVEGLEQLNDVPNHVTIKTFDETFDKKHGPFMDTAAVMQELDLIISTDTATAHIAGALGRPVWLLLPYATDWRWLAKRADSPWYPTMRIFKQPNPFDWDSIRQKLNAPFFNDVLQR